MTQRYTYEIILKVEREGLLTVPVTDFRVLGRLDPERDFVSQFVERFAEHLSRRKRDREKAGENAKIRAREAS